MFQQNNPDAAQSQSDPLVATPIVVTLDQLRPYELDPRKMRNPLYAEIKASIRARGLEAPPAITRRPGAGHYIIRSGGNTRLAILRELWSETREERFFRIRCVFHPWPERGDIVALTGHLAENEARSNLTFIERAIAVEQARELYEQELGKPLSQVELARRLSDDDGYPISQSQISRMQEAVYRLLPCMPNLLYGGLGRDLIDKLMKLRNCAESLWNKQENTASLPWDFELLFQEVLLAFDMAPDKFSIERVQDELIHRFAKLFGIQVNALDLDIGDSQQPGRRRSSRRQLHDKSAIVAGPLHTNTTSDAKNSMASPASASEQCHIDTSMQSPALYSTDNNEPITSAMNSLDQLRIHIAQLACDIASEADIADRIEAINAGIGFTCTPFPDINAPSIFSHTVLALLRALSVHDDVEPFEQETVSLNYLLGLLLLGSGSDAAAMPRLSDANLVKLFHLIQLGRRLRDLEANPGTTPYE